MKVIDYELLKKRKWDKTILGYIGLIHEYKGRQQMYLNQKKDDLDKLVEIAKRQSTEASNEIEGITTSSARLKKLVEDKTTPKNRSEKEIIGYRNALALVHENYNEIPVKPNYIMQLHKEMYRYMDVSFGGKYKNSPNHIQDDKGNVIFKPLEPYLVDEFMHKICDEYNKVINEGMIDPLIAIPVFIHDFLCIHPFKDGNGRMSRLLTTLLLYQSGFVVGRYISLEKKIQETKIEYYDALQESSTNWHKNKNDDTPFIQYMLAVILAAYRDFEDRVTLVSKKLSALELVKRAVNEKMGKFTRNDIIEMCPEIKRASVENSLRLLCKRRIIKKNGKGRTTYYTKNS